jgi:hypothetical protein
MRRRSSALTIHDHRLSSPGIPRRPGFRLSSFSRTVRTSRAGPLRRPLVACFTRLQAQRAVGRKWPCAMRPWSLGLR